MKLLTLMERATRGPVTVIHNWWDTSSVYDNQGHCVAEFPIGSEVNEYNQDVFEKRKDANAELHAHLVNHAPAIAALVEAARKMAEFRFEDHDAYADEAVMALRKALAAVKDL